jgi:signal transduction histidine kinase
MTYSPQFFSRHVRPYLRALLVVLCAFAVQSAFGSLLHEHVEPYLIFVVATAYCSFSSRFASSGPAIFTGVAGLLLADFFFTPRTYSWTSLALEELAPSLMYVISVGIVVAMGHVSRSRRAQLEQMNVRIQEQATALADTNEGLRHLSTQLMHVQDEERRYISRELHDSTGQILTALLIELSVLTQRAGTLDAELGRRLGQAMVSVRQISDELRTMSYLLHPPLLDEMGLVSALRWFAEGFGKRSHIDVSLDLQEHLGRLPADIEMAVFRTVQECLTNIHRHSGSRVAGIALRHTEGTLIVEVTDAGKGMPPEKLAEIAGAHSVGIGLRGMRERAKTFGGSLEVSSGHTGTVIKMMIPCVPPDSNTAAHSQSASSFAR